MDDKTFMAKYVADESVRINERLKKMVQAEVPPSEEEKESVIGDLEETLSRLMKTLEQIQATVDAEDLEGENREEKLDA